MINPPRTIEEARKRRYGIRKKYKERQCAYRVSDDGWFFRQCLKKPSHGPAKLYCKQHARMVEKQEKEK